MKRNPLLLLGSVLVIALIAVGCGGDDDDGDTTASALTKTEFIQRADALCKQGDDQINASAERAFGNQQPTQEQLNSFATDTILPNIQQQIDGIRNLGVPEGDEDQVEAIVDAAQADIDKGEQDPALVTDEKSGLFDEAGNLAKSYGLTVCGQN